MKKLLVAVVALLFLLGACGKKTESTHTQSDGSTQADHKGDTTQDEINGADTTTHHQDTAEPH